MQEDVNPNELVTDYTNSSDWKRALRILGDPVSSHIFYLWGAPGVGKTHAAYVTAPGGLFALTMTPETPAAELRGHFLPMPGGGMEFHYGPVVKAMTQGARLVINEITHAGADALSIMYPILEDIVTSELTLPTGETIKAVEGFHVVLTDNCPPEDLPEAIQDRIEAIVRIDSYSPQAVATFSKDVQTWCKHTNKCGEDGRWISLRGWKTLDRKLSNGWELEEACIVTFGERDGNLLYASLMASNLVDAQALHYRRKKALEKKHGAEAASAMGEMPKAPEPEGERTDGFTEPGTFDAQLEELAVVTEAAAEANEVPVLEALAKVLEDTADAMDASASGTGVLGMFADTRKTEIHDEVQVEAELPEIPAGIPSRAILECQAASCGVKFAFPKRAGEMCGACGIVQTEGAGKSLSEVLGPFATGGE